MGLPLVEFTQWLSKGGYKEKGTLNPEPNPLQHLVQSAISSKSDTKYVSIGQNKINVGKKNTKSHLCNH